MHIFHSWSKWSDPIDTDNSGHKQQWRICTKCNKAKFKILPWDKQTALTHIIEAIKSVNLEDK